PSSLEVRAGRVLIVGLPDVTSPSDPLVSNVLAADVGGVLLTHGNVETAPQVQRLVSALQSRSHLPLVVAADEEPRRARTCESLVGSTLSARRLGNEKTLDAVQSLARSSAVAMARLGVTVDLAPVDDLSDAVWNSIIGDRSFSLDPVKAGAYALAYARGLQQ